MDQRKRFQQKVIESCLECGSLCVCNNSCMVRQACMTWPFCMKCKSKQDVLSVCVSLLQGEIQGAHSAPFH